jgi:hypothetical protein
MGSIITSLGAGIVYPNQVTLPAVNADRAGEVFIHQGQAWRFTDGTEGWDLPVGTPWPVKGYKEFGVALYQTGTDIPTIEIEFVVDITPTISRSAIGAYLFTFDVPDNSRFSNAVGLPVGAFYDVSSEDAPTIGKYYFQHIGGKVIALAILDSNFTPIELSTVVDALGAFYLPHTRIYPPLP